MSEYKEKLLQELQKQLNDIKAEKSHLDKKAKTLREVIELNGFNVKSGILYDSDGETVNESEQEEEFIEKYFINYHWVLLDRIDSETNSNVCLRWRGAKEIDKSDYEKIKQAVLDDDKLQLEDYYYEEFFSGADVDAPFDEGAFTTGVDGEIYFRVTAGDFRIGCYRNESNFVIKKVTTKEEANNFDLLETVDSEEVFLKH